MSRNLYPIPEGFAARAQVKQADYDGCTPGRSGPERFWGEIGRRIDWIKPFSQVKDTSFAEDDFRIRWFYDGTLNVSANCLDRHLKKRGDKTAIIWEGDDPEPSPSASATANCTSGSAAARMP